MTRTVLAAGELEAAFLPGLGMLGASLRHRGEELLGRLDQLDRYESAGSTVGIPFLHPWANRLSRLPYGEADRALLHFDGNGLPIHGVPGMHLAWTVDGSGPASLRAHLDWTSAELLAVFPYPHRVTQTVALDPHGLTVETALAPYGDEPVPVSFGFHPYLRLPGAPRDEWRLELPAMTRLALDDRGLPTGATEPFPGLGAPLRGLAFDDGFAGLPAAAALALSAAGRRLAVVLLDGYTHAQVYAPPGEDFVALEPMTAPTNALVSGDGLRLAGPGTVFRSSFRLGVESDREHRSPSMRRR